jgi:hypothetical protein
LDDDGVQRIARIDRDIPRGAIDRYSHAQRHCDLPDGHAHPDCHSNFHCDSHSRDCHRYCDCHRDANGNANCDCHHYCDAHRNFDR